MSTSSSVRIAYENLRSFDWSLVTANYEAVGNPVANPVRMVKISSGFDEDILLSFDGLNDHDFIAANSYIIYDYGSNMALPGGLLEFPEGITFYIKAPGALPTLGILYITVMYVSDR